MNDAARFFAGIVLLIFFGYAAYAGVTSYMAVTEANEELDRQIAAADRETEIVARIVRYADTYQAVSSVYASRDYYYRLILGNAPPEQALVLDRNLDQALTDCITRPHEDCLYPLSEQAGADAQDIFLRDAHRAWLVDFYVRRGELSTARDTAGRIATPIIRAAAFEQVTLQLNALGQDEPALESAAAAAQALSEADGNLIRAVATTQLAQMFIEIGEPGRALTILAEAPPMILAQGEQAAALDQTLGLLQIAATASLIGDINTIAVTAKAIEQIDTIDSGPVPRARINALLVADMARMQGVEPAMTALAALTRDIDRAFAQMLLAQNLALGGELLVADEVLQAGIVLSQSLGVTLPAELLVEVVGAQAALGYFPAATVTLSNIDVPTLREEAQYLLARYYLYAGRDEEALPLIEELVGSYFAPGLEALLEADPETRAREFASVDMAQRLLRFFRRGWTTQLSNFEKRLEDRNALSGMRPIAQAADIFAQLPSADINAVNASALLALGMSIRAGVTPLPVEQIIANACEGQGEQCRVDLPFLRGYAFRTYILPVLADVDLAVTAAN